MLNGKGYSLDVDGEFGAKTQAAVRDYQKKNKLAVDGIVGVNTWGALNAAAETSAKTTAAKKTVTASGGGTKASARPVYTQSKALKTASASLADWEKSRPAEYSGKYDEQIKAMLDGILAQGDFSYDLGSDPLYEMYRSQYIADGDRAMRDTVGRAAALSGGYANSYAATAGSEAYQKYLERLGDVALDLRDRAFDLYKYRADSARSDLSLLRSLDSDDYARYRDGVSDYYSTGDYLLNKVAGMSDSEYEQFLQSVRAWENDRDYAHQLSADEQAQRNFESEMAFKREEAARAQANADREYALAQQKAAAAAASSSSRSSSSSSKSSSSSSSKKSSTNSSASKGSNTVPVSFEEFVQKTGFEGIYTKREFTSREKAVEKYDTYKKYLAAMYKKYK